MSGLDKFIVEVFNAIINHNASGEELRALLDDVAHPVAQSEIDEKEVLLLLARQDKGTTVKELEQYMNKYFNSVEVARLVARHPSIEPSWLAHFMHFLPDDARANPNFEAYQQSDSWERDLRHAKPYNPSRRDWGSSLRESRISETRPWRYKVMYWLEHGSVADKRYILGLEKLDEVLIEPFTNDKSVHTRKEIAYRTNLSLTLARKVSLDKCKTVRKALADNKCCPAEVLVMLTKDAEEEVRTSALCNPACPDDAIHAAKLADAMKPTSPEVPLDKLSDGELIAILGDRATDGEMLGKLAAHEQAYVRAGVALHTHCPLETLIALANDSDSMVRHSVAFNPHAPTAILQEFLDSGDDTYHIPLASNPSLSEQQQLQLVAIASDHCRAVLADTTELESVWLALRDSPATKNKKDRASAWRDSLKVLMDSSGKGLYGLQRGQDTRQLFVAKLISRHPKCPPNLIGNYAYYIFDSLAQNPEIALRLLEDPNAIKPEPYADWIVEKWLSEGRAPGHVTRFYLHSEDIKRCRRAVDNWTACVRDLQPLVFSDDTPMCKRLAARQGNTRFMLEILARNKKDSVRELVAKNEETLAATLAFLAKDSVAAVKVAAMQHKNYIAGGVTLVAQPAEVETFRNKGPKRNRIRMAGEAQSVDILRDLAEDKVDEVRINVARNSNTSLDVLAILANDSSAEVRYSVAGNSNTFLDVLASLAKDPSAAVRRSVAYHDNSSEDLLLPLFGDSDPDVRLAALNVVNRRRSVSLEVLPQEHEDYDYDNRRYDESILAHFYDDEFEDIQAVVARYTTNVEIQQRLASANSEQVGIALAKNRQLADAAAKRLIELKNKAVMGSLIVNTSSADIYLAVLEVDESLAGILQYNQRLIIEHAVQEKLISHRNYAVRLSCAMDVSDDELLLLLAQDSHVDVRAHLCSSPNLKLEHVEALLEKPTGEIVTRLIERHPEIMGGLMVGLLREADEGLRAHIAKKVKMRLEWEVILRQDSSAAVRRALANNWNGGISKETKQILKNDPDEGVREALLAAYGKV